MGHRSDTRRNLRREPRRRHSSRHDATAEHVRHAQVTAADSSKRAVELGADAGLYASEQSA